MASRETHRIDEAYISALTWLAAGLATGVVLAVVALDQEVASRAIRSARGGYAGCSRLRHGLISSALMTGRRRSYQVGRPALSAHLNSPERFSRG